MSKAILSNRSLRVLSGLRSPVRDNVNEVSRGLRCNVGTIDQKFESVQKVEKFAQEGQFLQNEDRWRCIREIRESNCGVISDELAPADHYAYSRHEVSQSGWLGFGQMLVSIGMYDRAKVLPESTLKQLGLHTGVCQIAPRTLKEVLFGVAGAAHGLAENLKAHDSAHDRLNRGEPVRTDTLDKRARDYFEGKQWV